MDADLYTRWLGIPAGERPPNHYTLLSLPPFTHAPNAVEAAARAQMDRLDPYAMHPDREQRDASTRMMNEIAQARLVLADPVRRDEYDRELAAKLGVEPPGSGDESAMAETIAGGGAVVDPMLDINAFKEPESAELDFRGAATDSVPESLFQNQVPLQDADPAYARARSSHSTIPFSVMILLGLMIVALVVGAIVIGVVVLSGEEKVVVTIPPPPPAPMTPVVPEAKQYKFIDEFDKPELRKLYEIRQGAQPHISVRKGKLIIGSPDETPARVELIPRLVRNLFREATVDVRIEHGCAFSFGIAKAARLVISSTPEAIFVDATPGSVIDSDDVVDGWLKLPPSEALAVRLYREMGNVNWQINGQTVATSPDMSTRGYPTLILASRGAPGDRVAVDLIKVVYDADLEE